MFMIHFQSGLYFLHREKVAALEYSGPPSVFVMKCFNKNNFREEAFILAYSTREDMIHPVREGIERDEEGIFP